MGAKNDIYKKNSTALTINPSFPLERRVGGEEIID